MIKSTHTKSYTNYLKKYRKASGLSRPEVAHRIGLSKTKNLVLWEKGISLPDLVSFFKLCIIYKAMAIELYSGMVQKIYEEMRQTEEKSLPTIEF